MQKIKLLFFVPFCFSLLVFNRLKLFFNYNEHVVEIPRATRFKPYTIGLASHGRRHVLRSTIDKLKNIDAKIIVVDDGYIDNSFFFMDVTYIKLKYDVGLSMVRNKIVSETKTDYLFITDQDIQLKEKRDLDDMYEILVKNNYLLVAGSLDDRSIYSGEFTYLNNGKVEVCDSQRHMKPLNNGCVSTRRTLNIFMTRKEVLINNPWNNELKLQEHTVFFEQLHRNNINKEIMVCRQFEFHHNNSDNQDGYKKDRIRKKWGDMSKYIKHSCKETNKHLKFLHIPKTGGVSFYNEMKEFGVKFSHISPGGNEKCYPGREYTILREPLAHIFSQYTMCRYSKWGKTKKIQGLWTKNIDMMVGFDIWLDYFKNNTNSLGCYYPYDLQTRALLCSKNDIPHHYLSIEYNVNLAFENLKRLKYGYGLLEEYDQSICRFINKFNRKQPTWCSTNKTNPNKIKVTHNVPKHNYKNIPLKTKEKAMRFIVNDLKLYELAKELYNKYN